MFHCHSNRHRYRSKAGSDFGAWEEEWKRFRSEVRRRVEMHAAQHGERDQRSRTRRMAAAVGFSVHLTVYLTVIGALALINLVTSPFTPWFLWPAFGWGI